MKWFVLILLVANAGAFFVFRTDESQSLAEDLPRPVGSARLILIEELNFAERNALRIGAEVGVAEDQEQIINDSFNLLRQPNLNAGNDLSDNAELSDQEVAELEGRCEIIRADETVLPAIAERLRSVDMNPTLSEEVTSTPGPLMVYIEPFASAREAALELNVLRRENIESFIIAEGELQNGISVGVFSTEQNALARSVQLEAFGYQTDLYQYMVEESEYSINLPLSESLVLSPDYWLELQSDFPSLSRVQNSCF